MFGTTFEHLSQGFKQTLQNANADTLVFQYGLALEPAVSCRTFTFDWTVQLSGECVALLHSYTADSADNH